MTYRTSALDFDRSRPPYQQANECETKDAFDAQVALPDVASLCTAPMAVQLRALVAAAAVGGASEAAAGRLLALLRAYLQKTTCDTNCHVRTHVSQPAAHSVLMGATALHFWARHDHLRICATSPHCAPLNPCFVADYRTKIASAATGVLHARGGGMDEWPRCAPKREGREYFFRLVSWNCYACPWPATLWRFECLYGLLEFDRIPLGRLQAVSWECSRSCAG